MLKLKIKKLLRKIKSKNITAGVCFFFFFFSMLSMTFDYYLLCFKFNQFDLFTEVYHNCILYTSDSTEINTIVGCKIVNIFLLLRFNL